MENGAWENGTTGAGRGAGDAEACRPAPRLVPPPPARGPLHPLAVKVDDGGLPSASFCLGVHVITASGP